MTWFIARGEKTWGQYSTRELRTFIEQRVILPEDWLRQSDDERWRRAGEIFSDLFNALDALVQSEEFSVCSEHDATKVSDVSELIQLTKLEHLDDMTETFSDWDDADWDDTTMRISGPLSSPCESETEKTKKGQRAPNKLLFLSPLGVF